MQKRENPKKLILPHDIQKNNFSKIKSDKDIWLLPEIFPEYNSVAEIANFLGPKIFGFLR